MVDSLGKRDLKERMQYLDQQAVTLEQTANAIRSERREIMARACQSEHHRGWARPQDDFEHASDDVMNLPGFARTALPARRIPWSEQE